MAEYDELLAQLDGSGEWIDKQAAAAIRALTAQVAERDAVIEQQGATALWDAADEVEKESLLEPYSGATFANHAQWLRDRADQVSNGSLTAIIKAEQVKVVRKVADALSADLAVEVNVYGKHDEAREGLATVAWIQAQANELELK